MKFATQQALSKISYALKSAPSIPVLPPAFDLSDATLLATFGLQSPLPPVGNQGAQNSCVAWSVGYVQGSVNAALGSGVSISSAAKASAADLYAKMLAFASSSCSSDLPVHDALNVMVLQGVATEDQVPYSDQTCATPSKYSTFIFNSYSQLAVKDVLGIKLALLELQVLPIALNVYPDFEQATGSAVYTHSASDTSCPLGGHCVALVGYDDARAAFRIMNSWGTAWGDKGFLWIDYGTFQSIVQEVYVTPRANPLTSANSLLPNSTIQSGGITLTNAAASVWLGMKNSTQPYSVVVVLVFDHPVQMESVVITYVDPNPTNSSVLASYSLQQFARTVFVEAPISAATRDTIQTSNGYISTQIQGTDADGAAVQFLADTSLLLQ